MARRLVPLLSQPVPRRVLPPQVKSLVRLPVSLVLVVKVVQAVVPTPMMMVVMVKQEAAEAVVAEVPPMETQATLGMEEMVGTQILETQEILLIPILSQILL